MKNKCIRFYLKLDKIHDMSEEKFKSINWLPATKRVDRWIKTITYNFVNDTCNYCPNENCICPTLQHRHQKLLKIFFRKTSMGQKAISYIGPFIWNSLPDSIKRVNSLNTFKHNVKKHYLT